MQNVLEVFIVTCIAAGLLFVRHPSAGKMLSASRWMLLSWSILLAVHCFSPITFIVMPVTWRTWLYAGFWVGTFILADNVRFSFFARSESVEQPRSGEICSRRSMRAYAALAVSGALLLIYTHRQAASSADSESVMSQLRDTQLEGDGMGMLGTVATVLACCGLVVALVETCRAVRDQRGIPLRAWFSLAAYLAVTILTGGRPGFVLGTLSLCIVAIASIQLSGLGFARFRKTLLAGGVVALASTGYIVFVVSTRTVGFAGDMDTKIALVNSLLGSSLDPQFRESLRPHGVIGDTVIESFYYLGPQFEGLDYGMQHYDGPHGGGLTEFPYLTRRIENLSGTKILDPINEAYNQMFEKIGIFPHFFATAAQNTSLDFGPFLSIPFVFVCGVLSRRTRLRALQQKAPMQIAMQGLICTGAAWTIIFSPLDEQSWSFPLIWVIVIPLISEVTSSVHFEVLRKASPSEGVNA